MFHDPKVHGPMKLKLIVTKENDDLVTIHHKGRTMFEIHEDKVNQFNSEHLVFFNQDTKMIVSPEEYARIVTPVLYADGPESPPPNQNQPHYHHSN